MDGDNRIKIVNVILLFCERSGGMELVYLQIELLDDGVACFLQRCFGFLARQGCFEANLPVFKLFGFYLHLLSP